MILTVTFLVSGFLLLRNSATVSAQGVSAIDIGVSPPTTYFHIEPGKKKSLSITLEQKGTLTLEITPSLVDFSSDGETGQPRLDISSKFKYLTLALPQSTTPGNTTSFTLDPGKKKNVQLTLDIPSTAAEGEFPLTILFKATPDYSNSIEQPGSEVSAIVGSNLIVVISTTDRDRSNLTLDEIKTLKVIDNLMPISFTLFAKNSGHNATTASGSAQITNWQDKVVAEFPIYPDMVLAQSSRKLRTTQDLAKALEDPSLIASVFFFRPNFAFGPYTITATLEKTTHDIVETNTVSQTIFALPFSFVILILISIGVWAIFLYLRTKNKFDGTLEEN
jgi:hypothetical protein